MHMGDAIDWRMNNANTIIIIKKARAREERRSLPAVAVAVRTRDIQTKVVILSCSHVFFYVFPC
jgi:hypothetical protein